MNPFAQAPYQQPFQQHQDMHASSLENALGGWLPSPHAPTTPSTARLSSTMSMGNGNRTRIRPRFTPAHRRSRTGWRCRIRRAHACTYMRRRRSMRMAALRRCGRLCRTHPINSCEHGLDVMYAHPSVLPDALDPIVGKVCSCP
jgi:hypothetical protein